jgi:signal transduction histidine kinase
MKKCLFLLMLLTLTSLYSRGQVTSSEMLRRKHLLSLEKTDTGKIKMLASIAAGYRFYHIDSALFYSEKALSLARKDGLRVYEAAYLSDEGSIFLESGDIPRALNCLLQGLDILDKTPDDFNSSRFRAGIENRIGNVYMELGEYTTSINHYRISLTVFGKFNQMGVCNELSNIGNDYELLGKLDSAKIYQQRAFDLSANLRGTLFNNVDRAELRERLGNIATDVGDYIGALSHYRQGVQVAIVTNDLRNLSVLYRKMAGVFEKMHLRDSSFFYAKKTLAVSRQVSMKKSIYQAAGLLSGYFEVKHEPDSALFYARLAENVRDAMYGTQTFRELQLLTLREQHQRQQLEDDKKKLQYNFLIAFMTFALMGCSLIAVILWRGNRKQKLTNSQLHIQKEEITTQRNNLDEAFKQLKLTQAQLIQSEKMASLGELTAGIAHEIQNPLNFVNNFSEVNQEMLEELKAACKKPEDERDEELEVELINDLIENEGKINHHGKRADAIVKGMLEHSRAGNGQKEPADINALADEYLRLSYHGLRAKDKSFNVEMLCRFDKTLPKININSQDIGRVLLNLFNNAFYAVNQKTKIAGGDYKPEVVVTTSTSNGQVTIKVNDNGVGIPEAIKDKIMQPFFTTKPTGEGTGLGLSLTYDMVVKGHGGSIMVDSSEGEGSEFIISLPV